MSDDTEITVNMEYLIRAANNRYGGWAALLASVYANDLIGVKVEPATGRMTLQTCREIMGMLTHPKHVL